MITSDHGEEFWDHGNVTHGHTLFEELVAVPLIIRYPKTIPAGSVVKDQVTHIDLMPTLLDMAGLPIPKQVRGKSVFPLIAESERWGDDRVVFMESEIEGHLQAARTPAQKIIKDVAKETLMMFDLKKDPGEQRDLFGTRSAKHFSAMSSGFQHWQEQMLACTKENQTAKEVVLPAQLARQLKSLGYVR